MLKPVQTARLARTVEKIQRSLPAANTTAPARHGMDHTLSLVLPPLATLFLKPC